MSTIDQMVQHLQSRGYAVEARGDLQLARHTQKLNMLFKVNKGGLLFSAACGTQDRAKKDRKGFLDFINGLNAKASLARFYCDSDSDFMIEAWYPDYYDHTQFGVFLDAWETESTLLVMLSGTEGAKYLK